MSNQERLKTILKHYELMEKYKGERAAMLEMRKHVAWYLQGLPGSARVKTEISKPVTSTMLRESSGVSGFHLNYIPSTTNILTRLTADSEKLIHIFRSGSLDMV